MTASGFKQCIIDELRRTPMSSKYTIIDEKGNEIWIARILKTVASVKAEIKFIRQQIQMGEENYKKLSVTEINTGKVIKEYTF